MSSDIKKGYAEVNDTRLYYEVAGQGEPIILVHGWGFDTRGWNYQFEPFSKQYQVIRYDQRGFGKSGQPISGEQYSHVEDLKALMDHLRIEKAHLIGHSFGGLHVSAISVLYSERVLSLIMADGSLPGYQETMPSADLLEWIGESWRLGKEVGVEAAKERFYYGSPEGVLTYALSNPKSAVIMEEMKNDYSGYNWTIENNRVEYDIIDRLEEMKTPTLVVVGELNPSIYHEVADYMVENIHGARKYILKGAGHGLMLENPEDFNREVLSFLSSL